MQEAPNHEAYRRRLAIWLTHISSFYAHQVATMLHVSKQAVWWWVGQYNKEGPQQRYPQEHVMINWAAAARHNALTTVRYSKSDFDCANLLRLE